MVRKVVLSPTAKLKLENLLLYLKMEWSDQVKNEFIHKLDLKISQVCNFPKSCPESKNFRGLHKCVVTKQTTFYYRVMNDVIEIATLFDTRQDPEKLKS